MKRRIIINKAPTPGRMAESKAALRIFNHSFDLIITDSVGLGVLSKWARSWVPREREHE